MIVPQTTTGGCVKKHTWKGFSKNTPGTRGTAAALCSTLAGQRSHEGCSLWL